MQAANLRLGIQDQMSGHIGTIEIPLPVPPPPNTRAAPDMNYQKSKKTESYFPALLLILSS